MSPLSKGIRVTGTGDPVETTVIDIATGERIRNLKALTVNIDAESGDYRVVLVLDCPFEYDGPAEIAEV